MDLKTRVSATSGLRTLYDLRRTAFNSCFDLRFRPVYEIVRNVVTCSGNLGRENQKRLRDPMC